MVKNKLVMLSLGIVFLAASCTKKGNTGLAGPAGPAGPSGVSFTGAINGHVSLYDMYGTKQNTGLDAVQLMLKGGATATADQNGYYFFGNVSTGTYFLSAATTGYGATMIPNIEFLSDTMNQDIKLSAIPNFNPTALSATYNHGSAFDSVVITVTPDTKPRNLILFVNNKMPVNNFPANYLLAYVKAITTWQTNVVIRVPASDLNGVNIFYGEMVYYAAYSYVTNDVSAYEDPSTGRNVYTAVGAAPLVDSAMSP